MDSVEEPPKTMMTTFLDTILKTISSFCENSEGQTTLPPLLVLAVTTIAALVVALLAFQMIQGQGHRGNALIVSKDREQEDGELPELSTSLMHDDQSTDDDGSETMSLRSDSIRPVRFEI